MEKYTLLLMFYKAARIPVQLLCEGKLSHKFGTDIFRPNPAAGIINSVLNGDQDTCYTVSPEHMLCGYIKINETPEVLIVGPAMASKCTLEKAQKILSEMNQPANRADELLSWLATLPICTVRQFCDILKFLNFILSNDIGKDTVYIPYPSGNILIPSPDTGSPFIEHIDNTLEKQMLSCVEYGNISELQKILIEISIRNDEAPMFAHDAIRSNKNFLIHAVGIVSRTALRGGLDSDTTCDLASRYMRQIEMYDKYSDMFPVFNQMLMDFTHRTAKCRSVPSNSLIVTKIIKVIQAHLYEKLTPTDISNLLKMNCSYLCRHFKQETGMTITEYTNRVKITECMRLLESTKQPLNQIYTQLGFSSQSYMQKVFKKITGVTPLEYRSNIKTY